MDLTLITKVLLSKGKSYDVSGIADTKDIVLI